VNKQIRHVATAIVGATDACESLPRLAEVGVDGWAKLIWPQLRRPKRAHGVPDKAQIVFPSPPAICYN
jgi:hypothetical protein